MLEKPEQKQKTDSQKVKDDSVKLKLSFLDVLKGFSSVEERDFYVKMEELFSKQSFDDLVPQLKGFVKVHPEAKKIIKLLAKTQDIIVRQLESLKLIRTLGEEVVLSSEKTVPQDSLLQKASFSGGEIQHSSNEQKTSLNSEKQIGGNVLKDRKTTDSSVQPGKDDSANIYTKLFQKEKKKDATIMDKIVIQVDSKKNEEDEKFQEKEKEKKSFIRSIFNKPRKDVSSEEILLEKAPIHWEYGLFIASIVFAFFMYSIFFIQLDRENRFLGLVGIDNLGYRNQMYLEEIESIQKNISEASRMIEKLESSSSKRLYTEQINLIKDQRIYWSEILKQIEIVTNRLPSSYYDDIAYTAFSFDESKQKVKISSEVKNEKVFTLIADLIDIFEESEYFVDVDFSKFNKAQIKDSNEYSSNINLSFQYLQGGSQ